MKWISLEKVWKLSGQKKCNVRFMDWAHQIKYFTIMGESTDGRRFVGTLDSGEKISYSKRSRGWELYQLGDELKQAHAV